MQNIHNRVTIPVNFTARKSIKSEVAKALYNRVDSILAKMDRHEKTALKLVEELSLKASRYQYKSQRKAFVELLKKNLDGVPLSSIRAYLCVSIVETANKLDWKCVFSKRSDKQPTARKRLPIVNADPAFREYLVGLIAKAV
jgi:hypothetical protein